MHIIELKPLYNGAHRNMKGSGVLYSPENWSETAVIPDDMVLPKTFPFVNIVAEEMEYYRVIIGDDGMPTNEKYTMLTVTKMTEGIVPEEEPEEVVTQLDRIEAQVTYTAMMTDTLLEV